MIAMWQKQFALCLVSSVGILDLKLKDIAIGGIAIPLFVEDVTKHEVVDSCVCYREDVTEVESRGKQKAHGIKELYKSQKQFLSVVTMAKAYEQCLRGDINIYLCLQIPGLELRFKQKMMT